MYTFTHREPDRLSLSALLSVKHTPKISTCRCTPQAWCQVLATRCPAELGGVYRGAASQPPTLGAWIWGSQPAPQAWTWGSQPTTCPTAGLPHVPGPSGGPWAGRGPFSASCKRGSPQPLDTGGSQLLSFWVGLLPLDL